MSVLRTSRQQGYEPVDRILPALRSRQQMALPVTGPAVLMNWASAALGNYRMAFF
jgi:hypothetical protein